MKIYAVEDELYPVFFVETESNPRMKQSFYQDRMEDVDDHLVKEYLRCFKAFIEARDRLGRVLCPGDATYEEDVDDRRV